jgi:cobalt-zinc-cadmium efflux system protein
VDGVLGIHDLHVWTVTSGLISMSGHVEVTGQRDWHETLLELTEMLRDRFAIAHVTLQPEVCSVGSDSTECSLDSQEGRAACLAPAGPVKPHTHHH